MMIHSVKVLPVPLALAEADVFVKNCVSAAVLQLPRRSPTTSSTALVGELGVRPLKIELLRTS